MSKRKKVDMSVERSIRELILKHGVDPAEEMLKMAFERTAVPPDIAPELLASLLRSWDMVTEPDGARWFVAPAARRMDIWKELAQYVYPKLRSTETKSQVDFNFNVTIKSFTLAAPGVVVALPARNVTPAAPRVIPEYVEPKEEEP